jgi:hypothetical protein
MKRSQKLTLTLVQIKGRPSRSLRRRPAAPATIGYLGLTHKTALVLGGGGGLGRAISKALAGEGANVAICRHRPDAIAGTEEALAAGGGKWHWSCLGSFRSDTDRCACIED